MAGLFAVGIVTIPTSHASAVTPSQRVPGRSFTQSYDVTMIDVDIPLNRWGDHDPPARCTR